MSDSLRERIARGMFEVDERSREAVAKIARMTWGEIGEQYRDNWRERADAALAAIEAFGTHVVVPVEPTEKMLDEAGHAFADAAFAHIPGDLASVNRPFQRFYRAMIAARPRDAAPTGESDG